MSKFMTGALLGLAVGLLVAPEKGEDTRESLMDNYEKIKDKVLRLTGRAGARIDDLRTLLGKEIEGISDDVRARISTILDEEGAKAEDKKADDKKESGAKSADSSKAEEGSRVGGSTPAAATSTNASTTGGIR